MKNLTNKFTCFIIFLTLFNTNKTLAQDTKFTLSQDTNFEKLIAEKHAVNNTFSIYKNFSIQLAHGEKTEIENNFYEFKNNNPETDATIIYAEPKYKLIIGNYRNKIDAERNLKQYRKKYPEAFIVRLTK